MGANFHNHSSKSTKLCDSKIAEAVRKSKKMIKKKKWEKRWEWENGSEGHGESISEKKKTGGGILADFEFDLLKSEVLF
jgi:hypothetical protein